MGTVQKRLEAALWFVAAEFWDGATGRALANGLRKLNEPVVELDKDSFLLSGPVFSLRLASRIMRPIASDAINEAIIDELAGEGFSYLLIVKGEHVRPATIQTASKLGAFSIVYYPDMHFHFPNFDAAILEQADVVCTTKRFQLPYLKSIRGERPSILVQHGYSPTTHVPIYKDISEHDFRYDICYVGNPDWYKLEWLVELARCFPDKRIVVAGHRWRTFAEGTALAPYVLGHVVTGGHFARLHQLSRINIAIHGGRDLKHGWQDDVSTRTFEIPACRGFMLHIDNEEVRGLYDVPTEIDTFSTPDEMCAKVAHYLAHPELRAAMVERAYRRAVPAYSYDSRAQEIYSIARAASDGQLAR